MICLSAILADTPSGACGDNVCNSERICGGGAGHEYEYSYYKCTCQPVHEYSEIDA